MRRLLLIPLLLQMVSCAEKPADKVPLPAAPTTAASHREITIDDYKARLQTISSDEFGGRGPGTEGEKRTVDYLTQSFAAMGLEPGNHGKWVQEVSAVAARRTNSTPLVIQARNTELKLPSPDEYVAITQQQKPEVLLEASPVVYGGYCINAPERHWNDFAGIDVAGKTVICLVNDPGNQDPALFDGRAMTYYGRYTYKFEEAARRGAAAVLVVHETSAAGYPWSPVATTWAEPRYALPLDAASPPVLPVAGWITTDAARKVFAAAGLNFDTLKAAAARPGFKSVPLDARASADIESAILRTQTSNVLALKRGSKRPDEVIVYTAHWDHLGTDKSLKGHQIYNGAIDNGTGVAAVLEIARKFAGQSPERSVLFIAVTLEESGLLGSAWYVAHPVFPMDHTVADINIDALAIIGPTRDMEVTGSGYSELDAYLARALAAQGRYLLPDQAPERGNYFRSDHFNFAKAGVPALYAGTGSDLVEGGTKAGQALLVDYGEHHYHQTTDTYNPDWDFRGVIQDVEALYQMGATLANETTFPAWTKDGPFRAKRQAMMDARH
jgi:Zn-dependent M28 family amino/carboxypeptidase